MNNNVLRLSGWRDEILRATRGLSKDLEPNADIAPTFFLLPAFGPAAICPVPGELLEMDGGRDALSEVMNSLVGKLGAVGVGMVAMSWMKSIPIPEGMTDAEARQWASEQAGSGVSIANDPARKEIVVAAFVLGDRCESYLADVERSETAAPVLGAWDQQPLESAFIERVKGSVGRNYALNKPQVFN